MTGSGGGSDVSDRPVRERCRRSRRRHFRGDKIQLERHGIEMARSMCQNNKTSFVLFFLGSTSRLVWNCHSGLTNASEGEVRVRCCLLLYMHKRRNMQLSHVLVAVTTLAKPPKADEGQQNEQPRRPNTSTSILLFAAKFAPLLAAVELRICLARYGLIVSSFGLLEEPESRNDGHQRVRKRPSLFAVDQ